MSRSVIAAIVLEGELEIGRREEIRRMLVVPPDASGILLDFVKISYADSTALAELLRFRNDAHEAGARVAILVEGQSSPFRRLLAYAGLGDAFAIFDDRGAALTYLGGAEA